MEEWQNFRIAELQEGKRGVSGEVAGIEEWKIGRTEEWKNSYYCRKGMGG